MQLPNSVISPFKVSLLVATVLALTACGGGNKTADGTKATPDTKPSSGKKTLVYCSEGSPEGFDPAQFTSGTTFDATSYPIFNMLAEFKNGETSVQPALATSWDVSPDGKTYTFHLRDGVKFGKTDYFTPTRDFNADDVVFTFSRLTKKDFPFNKSYPAEFPYASDMGLPDNILDVKKIDDKTVEFKLKDVDAAFIQNIAMPFTAIQSAEYAAQLEKAGKASELNNKPVGTGAFIFKDYQKDTQIRYAKNPDYWDKDKVKLDNLIFVITKDSSVRLQKIQAGECHVSAFPKTAEVEAAKKDTAKVKVLEKPGFNLGYLAYNTTHKPLDKLEVRQALDMAINKDAILQAVYQGAGTKANAPMPPTQWGYNDKLTDAPYDPAKAKELLKAAGVAEGTEISLWAMPVQRPYNPNAKLMAEMIQADWAKIGIKGKITSYEWGEYLKRAKNSEDDTILVGWTGDNGDPDNWLGVNLSCKSVNGNNYAKWCNKDFDKLVNDAVKTTDQNKRTEMYLQAQEIFKKELPWTTIAHSVQTVFTNPKVDGFQVSPFGAMDFKAVDLK